MAITPPLPPPVCVAPPPQMLVVLRAETWPAFDQSDLERRVLDEAAELFGEPVERLTWREEGCLPPVSWQTFLAYVKTRLRQATESPRLFVS